MVEEPHHYSKKEHGVMAISQKIINQRLGHKLGLSIGGSTYLN